MANTLGTLHRPRQDVEAQLRQLLGVARQAQRATQLIEFGTGQVETRRDSDRVGGLLRAMGEAPPDEFDRQISQLVGPQIADGYAATLKEAEILIKTAFDDVSSPVLLEELRAPRIVQGWAARWAHLAQALDGLLRALPFYTDAGPPKDSRPANRFPFLSRSEAPASDSNHAESPAGREQAELVIICALDDPELVKVKSILGTAWKSEPETQNDPHLYYRTSFTSAQGTKIRVVASAPTKMGLSSSAVLATKMILYFRPRMVAMVGIAAGADPLKQGIGGILAANQTFDYAAGKISIQDGALMLAPDPNPLAIDTDLDARLRRWMRRSELSEIRAQWPGAQPTAALTLEVGPMGSGAAVLDATAPIDEVRRHWRKLIGIEMEAYAVHRACADALRPPPRFLCLKSISDFPGGKDDQWRHYAAFTAAEFCHRFLIAEWDGLFPIPAS